MFICHGRSAGVTRWRTVKKMRTSCWLVLQCVIIISMIIPPGSSLGQVMVRKLMRELRGSRHPTALLNKLFRNFLPDYDCVQVETDHTLFAESFLEDLHESEEVPALVTGAPWSDNLGCYGFLVLATTFAQAKPLVKKLPNYADHRMIIILKGAPAIALNEALMSSADIYLDADVILVASGDLNTGYIMAQPKRYFVYFSKPFLWPYDENGPKDFLGRTINMLTYNCSLFTFIGPINNATGEPEWFTGVEVELVQDIAYRLNLKPKYKIGKVPLSGSTVWYRKDLMERRANGTDIAFCGILMSSKKMTKDIIMTTPVALVCLKLLVPRPYEINSEWDGIFEPFAPDLWMAIATVVLSTTFVLQRLTMGSRKYRGKSETKSIQKYEGLGGSLIQMISILVMTNVPKSTADQGSIRPLLTWFCLFTMILTTTYSSSLIAHLTNQEFHKRPHTIEELVKRGYRWSMTTYPDFSELLNLKNPWHIQWKYRFKLAKSKREQVEILLKEKQALWGYHAFGGFTLPQADLPDFVLSKYEAVNNCFMEYFIGFAIREGSPFESSLNRYIQAYLEAGLIDAQFKREYRERYRRHRYILTVLRRTKGRLTGPKGLQLQHLLGIWIVWVLGTVIAIVVFLLEMAQKLWI